MARPISSRIVRESAFRHVFGEASKECYQDIRYSTKATESAGVRGNELFVAIPWEAGGGGQLAVIAASNYGRLSQVGLPMIKGHAGGILDFEFNPFNPTQVLTACEDTKLRLWELPREGLKDSLVTPELAIDAHSKKLTFSTFHPTANLVCATAAFDLSIKVWNLETQGEIFATGVADQLQSLKWSPDGKLLAYTCKDKTLNIVDPRSPGTVHVEKSHEGTKAQKVEWLSNEALLTSGFSTQAERQVKMWSLANALECVNTELIDQGSGALYPTYDSDTKMLYLAGRGDGNVRFYEVDDSTFNIFPLSAFSTSNPAKGFDFLPKRCVDVGKKEVARALKVESSQVVPISFICPRKADAFQSDIYPDCLSGTPSISADEWGEGGNREPVRMSLDPAQQSGDDGAKSRTSSTIVTRADLIKQLDEAKAAVAELEAENSDFRKKLGLEPRPPTYPPE
eukprot:CAMPEP_0204271610 /NCGR_PEP_ID=MMETSP0468-20130131/20469_1 /ASSEMBLY_ACC=CAM_ASM_000383 /TAXON_ID=2969 /ORGANISM="Oxyrrhis marina" /LENGTH=453 /DNA_ID=CAMNT_0051247327 /DNA_START=40 /DNA_END=1401 /DNA_ORIENTATION=-